MHTKSVKNIILNFIKRYFIRQKTELNLQKKPNLGAFSYQNIQKVALLLDFSTTEKIDAFMRFQKEFHIASEHFIVLGYKSETNESSVNGWPVFTDKDISTMGVIHNYHADRLCELEFDLLLNFFQGEQLALELLSSSIRAKLRVGLAGTSERLHDLIIHYTTAEQEGFLSQTKKIIQTIA